MVARRPERPLHDTGKKTQPLMLQWSTQNDGDAGTTGLLLREAADIERILESVCVMDGKAVDAGLACSLLSR